jgi:predicted ABC-type ATPase
MNTPQSKPVVLVVAGPNGADKTTCAEGVLGESLRLFHFVNADMIAKGLSAFTPQSVAMQAGRLMIQRLEELSSRREDFTFETTLAGRTHVRRLHDLKQVGYRIDLLYISLPQADLCVERVAIRVSQGGHNIPESDIRRRFHRSLKNLFNFHMPLADSWKIYDNSGGSFRLIAEGGQTTAATLLDKASYEDLQKQAYT